MSTASAARGGVLRVAALGDLHYSKNRLESLEWFAQIAGVADVALLCGDLTDFGLPEEAQGLARELAAIRVPMFGVLGNHDFQSDQAVEVAAILGDAGVRMLDGDACEHQGVGFAGAKGFAGGFGRGTLAPWGEPAIKAFVQEALDEAIKLESALSRLRTPSKVVLLHYSPIADTVVGEPEQIFPFLGSSRLEEPINRLQATLVVHGHAHRGTLEGRTSTNIPVYNIAAPLLRRAFPDAPPFRVFDVPIQPPTSQETG